MDPKFNEECADALLMKLKPHQRFRTKTAKAFIGYYGLWARLYPHHYSAETRGGERTVWKAGPWTEIGCFTDRLQALRAAKAAALERISKD